MILSIDPGSVESAYVIIDKDLKPVMFEKIENEKLLKMIYQTMDGHGRGMEHLALEMVASYGMAVGAEVFETVFWIGRFLEASLWIPNIQRIYRKEEKMNLCHSMKAKDSNITQALVDRFAYGQSNHGKGTIKAPGWFYGFKKDVWQAYAIGVTYHDLYIKPQ